MTTLYFNPITKEHKDEILKQLNTTENNFKKGIESIQDWLKTQPHLPRSVIGELHIQGFLLIGRGSVEKAKQKIDMYYTMRSLFPDVFENSHPFSNRMLEARKFIYIVPLPKLCKDNSRIVLLKLKDVPNPSDLDPNAIFAHLINIVDIRFLEDFCSGHTIVFDLEHCKLQHVSKINPIFIRNIYIMSEKALTTRIHGFHLINAPKIADPIFHLIKSIVKPKLANKIFLHKDLTSVIGIIEKEILPRDYGGNDKPLAELEEAIFKKFNEYNDFYDLREKCTVNEELRPTKNINDDILGYHGNFKKLDVD